MRKCLSKGRCSRGQISRHSSRLDYYANPSAMQATGKASGPGHAHYRRIGPPTGQMSARPTTKQARRKTIAVNGRYLIIRKSLESQRHGIQRAERPRIRSPYPRVQRRHQTRVLLIHCHPNHFRTILVPGTKERSVPVAADTTMRNSRLNS